MNSNLSTSAIRTGPGRSSRLLRRPGNVLKASGEAFDTSGLDGQHSISFGANFRLARLFYYLGMGFVAADAIRPFGGFDVSDWLFFASIAAVIGSVLFRGARLDPSLPRVFVFGFALFAVGALFTIPVALHPADSAGVLARFAYTVTIWFALGTIVLRTRKHIEIAIGAWIASIALSGLAAIIQVKWGAEVFAAFTTVPQFSLGYGFPGRQIGLSQHPNDLGAAAAIAAAPAILFATTRVTTETYRYLSVALLCLVLAGIVLSASVTAFGVGIAATVIWAAVGRTALKRFVAVLAITALASFALVAINQAGSSSVVSPTDRVAQTLGLVTTPLATGLDRLNLDLIAWDVILTSPLLGHGLDDGSVADAMGSAYVHNMFLFVWIGAGIFGFIGLLTMVASLLGCFVTEWRRATAPASRSTVLALGISFASFVMVTLASPIVFTRNAWIPAVLLLPLRAIRMRSQSASQLSDQTLTDAKAAVLVDPQRSPRSVFQPSL